MLLSQTLILLSLTSWIFAWQNQYKVVQDNLTLEYLNEKVLLAEVGVYIFNETTKPLKISLTPLIDLPDDTKIAVVAYKWLNNAYRLGFFEIRKTFKYVIEMELFDLQSLFVRCSRPPMIWPLEKGVTYRSVGWYPDSRNFPPNTPGGKYKFVVKLTLGNNTNILIISYYGSIVYK